MITSSKEMSGPPLVLGQHKVKYALKHLGCVGQSERHPSIKGAHCVAENQMTLPLVRTSTKPKIVYFNRFPCAMGNCRCWRLLGECSSRLGQLAEDWIIPRITSFFSVVTTVLFNLTQRPSSCSGPDTSLLKRSCRLSMTLLRASHAWKRTAMRLGTMSQECSPSSHLSAFRIFLRCSGGLQPSNCIAGRVFCARNRYGKSCLGLNAE